MYTNNTTMFPGEYFGNFPSNGVSELSNFPSSSAALVVPPPPPLIVTDKFAYNEFESLVNNSSVSSDSYGSTPCSSASYGTRTPPSFIQRSVSSHSLQKTNGFCGGPTMEYLDSDTHVRRVYSTGDLNRTNVMQQSHHQRSESPLSNESSSSIIEGMMSKACRYSPEEKKERIEKYRSKRTQRNFNKKIKYACRKTLADSRPRIRGRFARNEDFEKSPDQVEWGPLAGEEDDEDDDNWVHFLDALSANLIP